VLLQGETGTGKGLVVQVLHASGSRARGPFVAINCAAIPDTLLEAELFGFEAGAFSEAKRAKPGLFETASGGSLFLDEIDALPGLLQGKLLTVLEAKRVRWRRDGFGWTCTICQAYGTQAKRMRWPSAHPVFNAESRDFAEVSEIAGEEYGVVREGDSSDLQVHCADADMRCP
jgi:hypothetical protein